MKYKNYYSILGLKGPRVSEDEIKSAYRKLTKKYHPDVNPEKEELFKDITEANRVLGDAKLRKRYNIRYYFHIFDNGITIDLSKIINSEFVKIFIGEEQIVKKSPSEADNSTSKSNLNEEIHVQISLEEAFLGATKQITYKPFGEPQKTISVRIPRGSNNESKIVLKGEGRKANFGTENGDLFLNFEIIPNPEFILDKIDLIKSISITPAEAAIGCEKSVESIDGMKYKLLVPAGTQPGELIKIKEAGFISKDGKRGDLKAKISVKVPKELTQQEKELYAKLKSIN